jgi:uncharacterized membrane protein YbhN (UPF0104 family)
LASLVRRIRWRKALYTVGIALGLALLAQQLWRGYQALQQAQACVLHPTYLFATLGIYIVAYFIQMAAWALIMRSLQAPLSVSAVTQGYALSFLPRYIPGSVWGYLSRNEWLAQSHQISYNISTTASLLETALLLLTAAMWGALYWLPTQWHLPQLTAIIVVAALAGSWLTWAVLPWLIDRWRHRPLELRRQHIRNIGLWLTTTLLYILFWIIQGVALVTIARTLCGTVTLGTIAASSAFALAWMIGFLIVFVPAGMGVREWTLSALLVTFAAMQPGEATLIAVLSRFGLILAEVTVLVIGLHGQIQARLDRRTLQNKS